jgi:phosphodiesterase/alkaline phosphatase D-like protein
VLKSPPVRRTLDYQRVEVKPLSPRTSYSLKLRVDDEAVIGAERHLREGRVTTLPAALPKKDEKPFTLLLGSCFYGPEDPEGLVGGTYHYMPEDQRPEIKVLCGDQVYLDNPWRETTLKWYRANQKPGLFRAMLFEKYVANWAQVGGEDAGFRQLLKDGANYFCSDDHEFWNNAPSFGGVGLFNTLTSGQRRWWFEEAGRLFRAFQSTSPLLQFEVPPLSICVADTRINRDNKGIRFMKDEDLESVGRWIEELQGPGVLVVGQPVLAERGSAARSVLKKGLMNAVMSYIDRDLPHYAQYEKLVGYIKASDHSIVVLTGDVHFGRVACGELNPGSETMFVEVISSPMHAVLGDEDEPLFGTYKRAPKDHFQITEDQEILHCRNHFMTVQFSSAEDGRVNVEVRAWPILRAGEEISSGCDVVFERALP